MTDNEVKQAFDRMSPDPEAEERMLANILSAAESAAPASFAPDAEYEGFKAAPASPARSRRRPARVILPLAACLVLLAGIGVFAASLYSLDMRPTAATQENSSGEAPRTDGPDGKDDPATGDFAPLANSTSPYGAAPYAQEYPLIDAGDQGVLKLVNPKQPSQAKADAGKVGEFITEASAYKDLKEEPIPCKVFAYPSDSGILYAVLYPDAAVYYLAEPFAR